MICAEAAMKMTTVMMVLIAVLIAGCGDGHYWYKRGATLKQAERACTECYLQAVSQRMTELHDGPRQAQATGMTYLPQAENRFADEFADIAFNNCMKGLGYREVSGEFLAPTVKKTYCNPTASSHFNIAGE